MERKDYALSPAQRADAREAFKILDGLGISLAEAARRVVHGKRALRRVTLETARDEFVRSRLTEGKRARTVEWYENKLALCLEKFGDRDFGEITRLEFFGWLKGLLVSEGTRAGIVRACRGLWRWGMAQEPQLVAVDITVGLKTTGPNNGGDAEFLTVPEVAAAMAAMGPFRSGAALLFWGAVRPEELAGRGKPPLLWRHVRVTEKLIRIPAEIAKSGNPRIIQNLPEMLWGWLEPGKDEEPVAPGLTRQIIRRALAAIRVLHNNPKWEWPHDATRHTFATYMFAVSMDAGKVAAWLGHEGNAQTFHRHYKGLATEPEGLAYLALRLAA